MSLQNSYSYRP